MSIITLLTDFGLKDAYVGLMKGVILKENTVDETPYGKLEKKVDRVHCTETKKEDRPLDLSVCRRPGEGDLNRTL